MVGKIDVDFDRLIDINYSSVADSISSFFVKSEIILFIKHCIFYIVLVSSYKTIGLIHNLIISILIKIGMTRKLNWKLKKLHFDYRNFNHIFEEKLLLLSFFAVITITAFNLNIEFVVELFLNSLVNLFNSYRVEVTSEVYFGIVIKIFLAIFS